MTSPLSMSVCGSTGKVSLQVSSRWCITSYPLSETNISASKCLSSAISRPSIRLPIFGHQRTGPHLKRILMPNTWEGHPLSKDHPARATEMGSFHLPDEKEDLEQEALRFKPEEWGMKPGRDGMDFIFLNVGPQHPGTHGVLRIVLQLDGEEIVDAVPEIGFHHRGAEKMGE